jgi:MerR family transcriptional regulator, glutamine synthetase repressor
VNDSSKKLAPVLSMSMVMHLTNLTARQIRYYEEHELIQPLRTESNRRIYSLVHVDELLEIQELLNQGINIAGIKKIFEMKNQQATYTYKGKSLTEKQLRSLVLEEYLLGS